VDGFIHLRVQVFIFSEKEEEEGQEGGG